MPPADSHKAPLTEDEIERITQWIKEGGEYQISGRSFLLKHLTLPVLTIANGVKRNRFNRLCLAQ